MITMANNDDRVALAANATDDEPHEPEEILCRRSVAADLEGLRKIATDAVTLTTRLVEAEHSRLDWFSRILYPNHREADRMAGIAGKVYSTIYAVNGLVGSCVGMLLSQLEPFLGESVPSEQRERAQAVLNGVIGDYLQQEENPLAICMQFRVDGKVQTDAMLAQRISESKGRLLLLVHGSCMSDLQWLQSNGHDHGAALAVDSNLTPIYLHYNSGLHISDNGKLLASHLNRLAGLSQQQQEPLTLHILAHSMGGLIVRSACHYATSDPDQFGCNDWVGKLHKVIFLGSPHHGALLERGGKWIDYLLALHPYSEPFSWLGKIRSKGVTDLGYGNVRQEDWHECHATGAQHYDRRVPTPLPNGVHCYAIAAVTSDQSNYVRDSVIGDGLVSEASALGEGHAKPDLNLAIPKSNKKTIRKVGHVGLLSSGEVYEAIRSFLDS